MSSRFTGGGGIDERIRFAVKRTDQNRNNSEVLVNDTEIFFPLAANSRYFWLGEILFSATAVADFDMTFIIPAGATGAWTKNLNGAGGAMGSYGGVQLGNGFGEGSIRSFIVFGWIETAATPGNLQFQFAQNVAEVSNAISEEGSSIVLFKVPL